jgi:alkylation response protein AidB-like acyl-CoA dehydrogenase
VRYDASDDQLLLRETTRRFLESRSPISETRSWIGREPRFDAELWRAGAELGWISLFIAEALGGAAESASGVVDAVLLAEELGRVIHNGPFLPTNVVAFALSAAGTEAQREAILPRLAAGEQTATWCFAGAGAADGTRPGTLRARSADAGFVLEGESGAVQAADSADHLLVTARHDEGLSQFLLPRISPGLSIQPCEALDPRRRLANVRFDGVVAAPGQLVGEAGDAAGAVERQLQLAVVLQCAETVGVLDRALEMTLEYARERVAFGRPIGSYQALKHRLADHATALEAGKALTDHAAQSVEDDAPDAAIAISLAKSHVGRSGSEIARDCVQIHGGIGVTWEHDLHLFVRRAISNEALWGTPAAHHERLCRLAGLDQETAA